VEIEHQRSGIGRGGRDVQKSVTLTPQIERSHAGFDDSSGRLGSGPGVEAGRRCAARTPSEDAARNNRRVGILIRRSKSGSVPRRAATIAFSVSIPSHNSPTLATRLAIVRSVNAWGVATPLSTSFHVHGADTGAWGLARTA